EARVQEDLQKQLEQTNDSTIRGIKKESEERRQATEKAVREQEAAMREASQQVRKSAGKIFDVMGERSQGFFKTIANLAEGAALSIARTMFQDIVAGLFTPLQLAFQEWIKGITAGIAQKLGGIFGNILGVGGSA